jgi:hypothetical protein
MKQRKVHILPTDITPEVMLDPEGIITIKGRALAVNKTKVPLEIMSWLKEYINDPAELTTVIIALEYLNSSTTTSLVSILQEASKVILKNRKIAIHWYFEEDDDDMMERGEYISATLDIQFEFKMTTSLGSK